MERSKISIDIARELDTDLLVLWLAREGTYIRDAKDSQVATQRLVEAINGMLAYDPGIRICIEPKPNEPMDHAYLPTTGHAIAIGMLTDAPDRVGVNIESAHAILAGLDPSDEMGFALSFNKLWTVHLNDQNGLKFDQDKSFGSVDLRRAFNQVRILDQHDYGKNGEWVGLDVKAMRTQKDKSATAHLSNSLEMFQHLLAISRSMDEQKIDELISERDYEALDLYIMKQLIGK
jgi:xylose isomerase